MKAGWSLATIGSFANTGAGGTPTKSNKSFYDGGRVPWLMSGEVANPNIISAKNFITEKGLKGSAAKLFPTNSVVVAMYGATAGEAGILRFEAATNQAVCAILPGGQHLPEYLYYYLLHAKPALVAQAVGNAQPNISQAKIKSLEVPLPPLEEQQQIVAILDEAFDGLARARANAEANLQNARELFDEVVNACFQMTSDSAVVQTTLGALAEFRNGLNYTRSSIGRSVKIVGVGDFKDHFTVPVEALSEINIDGDLGDDDRLRRGDILVVRSNGNRELIGRAMLVPDLLADTSFSGFTIRIRLKTDALLPEYLCEVMRTKTAHRMLIDGGGGANISNLNQRLLSSLPISFPEIAEQRRVLDNLARIRGAVADLIGHYQSKLDHLENLRQSLSQKAFAGELT